MVHPLARTRAWLRNRRGRILFAIVVLFHVVGALTSVRAVMETRTSQGALAWAISLNTFPYVTVPAYWVLGRSKFRDYELERQEAFNATGTLAQFIRKRYIDEELITDRGRHDPYLLERIARLPFTAYNSAELLVDGDATFRSIFESIDRATSYVLVQFYIVRDDGLGRELRDKLLAKTKEGVKVHFLYDEVGSPDLRKTDYALPLREAGADVAPFNSTKGKANRFQLNFRNHRKVVVVDGREAFVGGLNVGDEYLGKDPKYPNWRDTHMKVAGPAVQFVQLSFAEDWRWATGQVLDNLEWMPAKAASGDKNVLCLPSGPADRFETCTMFFLDTINNARKRLWIASPYFVPDEQVMTALKLAAIRGVDVRIITPEENDNPLVKLSTYSYLPECELAGVKVYWYTRSFMHQKVLLADDDVSAVGTANFDNRSFRLNFEITMVVRDAAFASELAEMLDEDLRHSRPAEASEMTSGPLLRQFGARASRLAAPIL
jgi:cardiolipin synthase A/B